ncbi:ABC transporter permease [Nibricoccus sp. IMCC34717]|uniref:ABC transporter permease n=1 Tax=Nibricoccus sp. IMCC34717 TaxID=3034021 RepID=UPI00384D73A8
MLRPILTLLRKDLTLFFTNKAAVTLTFVVPFVMIWVFGQVFGLNRKDEGPNGIALGMVNASTHPAAKAWVSAMEKEKGLRLVTTTSDGNKGTRPLTEADVRAKIEGSEFNFAVVIPEDFVSNDRFGLRVKIFSNPRNEIETQMVNGLLQKTLFSNVPKILGQILREKSREFLGQQRSDAFNDQMAELIAKNYGGDARDIRRRMDEGDFFGAAEATSAGTKGTEPGSKEEAKGPDLFSRILKIDTEQVVGKDVVAPAATRIVGGFAMQFLLFALSAGATALLMERDQGLYHRLLAGPISRTQILIGRFIHGILIGILQLCVLFLSAQLLFGVDVVSHLPLLILVSAFAAAACASFGMLIASVARTVEAANGLSTLLILTMSAIGGAWFPLSMMPEFIQKAARFTIVYWSMQGFDYVLWNQAGLVQLLPTLGILTLITAGVMGLAAWQFSRNRLFG